MSLGIIYSIL